MLQIISYQLFKKIKIKIYLFSMFFMINCKYFGWNNLKYNNFTTIYSPVWMKKKREGSVRHQLQKIEQDSTDKTQCKWNIIIIK